MINFTSAEVNVTKATAIDGLLTLARIIGQSGGKSFDVSVSVKEKPKGD